jgi:Leucine-rich repeat (LRR) protein
MKKKFLFIIIAFTSFCNAQTINFTDSNFKAKLLSAQTNNTIASNQIPTYNNLYGIWSVSSYNKIDTNNDGEIQVSEALMVKWLNISNSTISNLSGIEYFSNLQALNCNGNLLAEINVGQLSNLQYLNCSSNNISTINFGNIISLLDINCQQNNLSSLNLLVLNNLLKLSCSYNSLNNLELSNLNQLTSLICNNNQLTQLNLINLSSLQTLSCSSNQIQNLDTSNLSSIVNIDCSSNQIMTLTLGNLVNLKFLTCHSNQISQLEIENLINLEGLYCAANQISVLNFSNLNNVNNLRCGYNLLTSLDFHNCPDLYRLECMNNNLHFLNIKNGVHSSNLLINNLYFQNNPNLAYICSDESEVNSVNIIANAYNINCNIGSYCSFTPGGPFYTIEGNQKFDINSNGCDSNDLIYPNLKCSITNGTYTGTFIANNSGSYNIPVQAGTHTVTPIIENPTYFNVTPNAFNISFPSSSSPYNQDFCITANGQHNDLEIALLTINQARPGFDAHYKLIYKNKGTTTQSGTINFTFDDSVLDFVSSNPNVSSQSTGSLNWNFTNLLPFESREINIVLNLNSPTETPALNSGDLLNYTAFANGQLDETPNDNIAILNQIVVNSYDPNDKTCLEGTTITPSMVGEYVHYLIRFENNGTANAQNIVVKDMIDINKFDINTLIPIKGSHNFETRISSTNKVEFIFQNINLPFDDANNDGYVSFKIKTKPNLVVGNTFSNSANIYFDYNFPIVTNNYTTTVQNTLGIQENNFINNISVYPNPVKNILNFKTEHNISKIEVYDITGRILSSNSVRENKIDLSELKTGNYILKLYTEKGIMNTKIIKE